MIPGGIDVTGFDMKRLDRRLREVGDPFGTGFPIVKKIISETAERHNTTRTDLVQKYLAWKWRK